MTFWLWLACVVPSLYEVHRYAGWMGVAAYLAGAGMLVRVIWRVPTGGHRTTLAMSFATAAIVLVAFVVVFPRVNVHSGRAGSDDDEALDLGVHAMISGRPPYAEPTYLGNVSRQWPGAMALAMPFTLAGSSAFQGPFWLALFFVVIAVERRRRGDPEPLAFALRLSWLALLASPVVMHEVLTGTDRVANTEYVSLGLWWLAWTTSPVAVAALWGVTLASRPNFFLLVPIAGGWLWHARGWRTAVAAMVVALAAAGAVTLPFYLRDPSHFGPAIPSDRLTEIDAILPHAATVIVAGSVLLAVVLGLRTSTRAGVFRAGAVVQAVPVVATMLVGAAGAWYPPLAYLTYGTFAQGMVFMWFAMAAPASKRRGI